MQKKKKTIHTYIHTYIYIYIYILQKTMRYELSRYTFIYPWKNLFKRIYNSMYCYILFMYTCIPAHRQYLLERAPTKVKVKKLRKINTHVQEEEAAYRNSKKLLVELLTSQTGKRRVMTTLLKILVCHSQKHLP